MPSLRREDRQADMIERQGCGGGLALFVQPLGIQHQVLRTGSSVGVVEVKDGLRLSLKENGGDSTRDVSKPETVDGVFGEQIIPPGK